MGKKIETLYSDEWLSLKKMVYPEKGINGYTFSHETRCNGKIIAVLPFKIEHSCYYYCLRQEVTPCWHETKQMLSSITGGYEKDKGIKGTVVDEVKEEAGYYIKENELIDLGTCQGTKSCDTIYHLFAVDVTSKKQMKAKGDGSTLESKAECVWMMDLAGCVDPLAYILEYRLNRKLVDIYRRGMIR